MLETVERVKKSKLNELRSKGLIPAVCYNAKNETISIAVNSRDFQKIWKEAGETSKIELNTAKGKISAMIHEVQLDPVKGYPLHIDFYRVEKGQKVTVGVPVEFQGVASVVKEQGAMLVKVLHEIEVEGEPQYIPQSIIIDITPLVDLDSQILAKEIPLPNNVVLKTNEDEVVVSVEEAKEEEKEEKTEEIDMSAIEVETKGKKETEVDAPTTTEKSK